MLRHRSASLRLWVRVSAYKICRLGAWLWIWFSVPHPAPAESAIHGVTRRAMRQLSPFPQPGMVHGTWYTDGCDKNKHLLSSWYVQSAYYVVSRIIMSSPQNTSEVGDLQHFLKGGGCRARVYVEWYMRKMSVVGMPRWPQIHSYRHTLEKLLMKLKFMLN